jgi:hypothetical protein
VLPRSRFHSAATDGQFPYRDLSVLPAPAPVGRGAWWRGPSAAQIFNLLYRRLLVGGPSHLQHAPELAEIGGL